MAIYRELGYIVKGIDVEEIGPDPYLLVVPHQGHLLYQSYEIRPKNCRITGFQRTPDTFVVSNRPERGIPGGVELVADGLLMGRLLRMFFEDPELRKAELGKLATVLSHIR